MDDFVHICKNGSLTEVRDFIIHHRYGISIWTRLACQTDRLDVIKLLVMEFKADVQFDCLSIACCVGNLEIVQFLVENKAYLNHNHPIFEAIKNKHTSVVKYLSGLKGIDIYYDYDCLLESAKTNLEILICIMHKYPLISSFLKNRLFMIACEYGVRENVEYLLSIGADLHLADDYPVQIAASNGHLDVVMYLCEAGADIQSENNSAVRLSSEKKHYEVVMYLCKLGADRSLISQSCHRYIQLVERTRNRAQKKIYFWWIPICYDVNHPSGCGKRMMLKNWEKTQELLMVQ